MVIISLLYDLYGTTRSAVRVLKYTISDRRNLFIFYLLFSRVYTRGLQMSRHNEIFPKVLHQRVWGNVGTYRIFITNSTEFRSRATRSVSRAILYAF